ncbi:hypothetical protein [Poritiphilus flavus]|uniref:Uncharacterized protein n=1 Tax=Poritiphilus flavus TaxID=2697053 RepID=A0A6L9EF38_9FLAO|nr:hypothetical protein [Poritiphilus flavus]NAS12899.1 hypothetical protein [Poritiphilus flavus]
MSVLKKYRKYNTSFVEVILERLNNLYDVELKSDDFIYLKDSDYALKYLKYSAPENGNIQRLIEIFQLFEESKFLIVSLPLRTRNLEPSSKEDSFDELVEGFDVDIKPEIIENRKTIEHQMGEHDPFNSYPLLIEDKGSLKSFFLDKEEEIEHFFIGNVLLVPIDMQWLMHFDYDLGAIHFAYTNDIIDKIESNIELKKLIYSADEISQLIIEANQ